MRSVTGRELARWLVDRGWRRESGRRKHEQYVRGGRVVIVSHSDAGGRVVPAGILGKIRRSLVAAGHDRAEVDDFLIGRSKKV